jgi:effector-binding domain-containing protein
MIERLVVVVAVFLAAFVAVGLYLPDEARTERSIVVDRPVITVFTLLNRPGYFRDWAPWSGRDPSARLEPIGPVAGVGAGLEWSGDPRKVGVGRFEIKESRPHAEIRARVELRGQGDADSVFLIERVAGGARVSWQVEARLTGDPSWFSALLSRYFGLLFDRWLGAELESGLVRFKAFAESLPGGDFSGLVVERVAVEGSDVLAVEFNDDEPGARRVAEAYGEISALMARQGIGVAGAPLFISLDDGAGGIRHLAAFPAVPAEMSPEGRVQWRRMPTGAAVRVVHRGAYEKLPGIHAKLAAWLAVHGLEPGGASWEQYVSNPAETPPSERVTHVYALLAPGSEKSLPAGLEGD